VKKCWPHDTVPNVMISISAGQRAAVVHARGEMGFACGAELIYDVQSKSEDHERHKLREVAGRNTDSQHATWQCTVRPIL
jgi:hypothetical protein